MSINIQKQEDKIIYSGNENDSTREIIAGALSDFNTHLYSNVKNAYVRIECAFGDVEIEVERGSTFDELWHAFKKELKNGLNKEAQLKAEKKKERAGKVYENFDELFEELEDVLPCDLRNDGTTVAEAVKSCGEIMKIISKCENLQFESEEQNIFIEMLKERGFCGLGEAAKKFVPSPNADLSQTREMENNIQCPLFVIGDLLASKSLTEFNHEIHRFPSDCCQIWLDSQRQTKHQIEKA